MFTTFPSECTAISAESDTLNWDRWSLALSSQACVATGFSHLNEAVAEYNTVATKESQGVIEKTGIHFTQVQQLAESLRKKHEPVPSSTPNASAALGSGMRKFCETTMHYAKVLDTLAQHNPEWVSLAWGAMKFLLSVPLEYEKFRAGIVQHLANLGEKFQLVQILLQIFPTARLVEAASNMFALFTKFLEKALRWLRSNQFKRLLKSTFRPFDLSIKPVLDDIDASYAILKEHADMHKLIYHLGRDQRLISGMTTVEQRMARILDILESLLSADPLTTTTTPRLLPSTETPRPIPLTIDAPDIITEEDLPSLPDMDSDLRAIQATTALLPKVHREGLDILRRDDFRSWITNGTSGVLWIEGFEVPGRPGWLTHFSQDVVKSACIAGYEVLYTFCSLHHGNLAVCSPVGIVRRFTQHLIKQYPISESPEAKDKPDPGTSEPQRSDLEQAWEVLVQCLRDAPSPVIYLVIEGADLLTAARDDSDFTSFLKLLSDIATPDALENKVLRIILTSVRPESGSTFLFGQGSKAATNILIRLSPVAARSRKQRHIRVQKRKTSLRSSEWHKDPSPTTWLPLKVDGQADIENFVPDDISVEPDTDFDIFDDIPAAGTSWTTPSVTPVTPLEIPRGGVRGDAKESADIEACSVTSLDIFEGG